MAYESLAAEGRDAWLDALDAEAPLLEVPALALYAPLLGVETDEGRHARMQAALDAAPHATSTPRSFRALSGDDPSGDRIVAIVVPLYLDFVELLLCRYEPDAGVRFARRGPLLHASEVFEGASPVREIEGVALVEVSFGRVVESSRTPS